MSDGVSRVSDGVRKLSDGVIKVSDGVRKVSDGVSVTYLRVLFPPGLGCFGQKQGLDVMKRFIHPK